MKIILFIIITFTSFVFSQVIEDAYSNGTIPTLSDAEIKNFSTVGYGFDPIGNSYNPHNIGMDSSSNLLFLLGLNTNIDGAFKSHSQRLRGNVSTVTPSILLSYHNDVYLISLSYTNDYLVDLKNLSASASYILEGKKGNYRFSSNNFEEKIIKNTFQLSFSYLVDSSLSLTLGILSPETKLLFDIHQDISPFIYKNMLFESLQYFCSMNYKIIPKLQCYFLFQSQSVNREFNPEIIEYNHDQIILQLKGIVSYFGRISYGLQTFLVNNLKLTFEMRHQFMERDGNFGEPPYLNYRYNSVWNNEFIIGASYAFYNHFNIGVLYSNYIKYDKHTFPAYFASYRPSALVISSTVNINNLFLALFYQYSKTEFEFIKDNTNTLSEISNFISLKLGYKFDL